MKFNFYSGLWLLFFPLICFACEQHEKLWLGIDTQRSFSENSPWLYSISSELRFINNDHPWQTLFFEGGVGRQILFNKNIWLGYRWSGHDPSHQFYSENRFFQQFIWPINPKDRISFISRSRLEEIIRENQHPMTFRLRKRISAEIKYDFRRKINPYFYDELFFRLNKTKYTSDSVLSENRLFLGVRIYLAKKKSVKIGYINQYQSETPFSKNQLNHILALTYSF
ncbi:hypothetical protein BEV13_05135 [Rickettsiella grylli]|uniref:DUF2490 domain-containing protein n=1 Tax=Rickettsiella grylli TaxID=59196 RepID=UPI0008FD4539|nr:DUF2490 domain-containing protein [Rickettsiella grylli]OIZ99731.1 hypothetical protein BEV13_05135 [Rickettsiella grylli]